MSFGRFSTHRVTTWMDEVYAQDKWMTLVSADPHAVSDPLTVELTTTRYLGTWDRTSATSITNSSALSFPGLPAGAHVAGMAAFDAEVNGNLIFADLLDTEEDYPDGGTYVLPTGEYVVGIDVAGA